VSLIIPGNPSNITTPLTASVTTIADNGSGAMRVTTAAPHLFGDADSVLMQATGSIVGSPVNGATYSVAIIDATHFDLVGTTYTSGTATGTATDFSLTPQILVPTDGDTFSLQLSGMLSALQALCDRTQYLRLQQVNPPTTSVGGVAGTSILTVLGGVPTFFTLPFQQIANDFTTIKSGSYDTTATLTGGTRLALTTGARIAFPPRVVLSDANHTIDVTQGDTFVLPNAPSTTRTITLAQTTGTPRVGERLRLIVPGLARTTGSEYHIVRSGGPAGLLANIFSSSLISNLPIAAEFQFAEGLLLSVTGAISAAGLIKLTLGLPAGAIGANPTDSLATGDSVAVASVGGVPNATGTWTITVNSTTQITLQGSTFAGSYTSGGTATITPGVWRLSMNSGSSYDGTQVVGVIPDEGS
jgi:hypothetical protein